MRKTEGNELMSIHYNESPYRYVKVPDDWFRDPVGPRDPCLAIRHVVEGEKGGCRLVTVVFEDGTHETAKCVDGDAYDVNVGVALCVVYRAFGSRTAFRGKVAAKMTKPRPKKAAAEAVKEPAEGKPKARRGRPRKVLNESSGAE